MKKLLILATSMFFASQSYAGSLADGGLVKNIYSVSSVTGPGNTRPSTSFGVEIHGSGLCAGKMIKFQESVNTKESLERSYSMLLTAYLGKKRVAIQGAYSNSNCDLGSQVRFLD